MMRTMTVRELSHGRKTTITAKKTYQTDDGEWIAEVDGKEFRKACSLVCQGVDRCACEDLQVEVDIDDDGKEYKVLCK